MMRFYKPGEKPASVTIGLQYNLLTCLLLTIGLGGAFLLNGFLFKVDIKYICILILAIIGRGLACFIQDYYRISNTNLTKYTIVAVVSSACFYLPAIVYVLLLREPAVTNILLVQLAGLSLFLLTVITIKIKSIISYIREINNKAEYLEYVKYGLPLLVVFLAASMFIRIDRYIIEYNVGLKDLGSYSAAYSLSNLAISSFFIMLTLPTYPEIIRKINEGDEQGATAIYRSNGNLILMVGLPLVFLACTLNTFVCNIFFGAVKGPQIAGIFPFVVVGTFLYNFKMHYFDQVFQFAKKTKVFMILGLMVGVCHLLLSYKLSKVWSTKGVAISGIALNLSAIIFIYYYSKSFFEIRFNRRICVGLTILSGLLISGYWLFYKFH